MTEPDRFTYLRLSPFRMPHQYEPDRRQGLTTAAADLAIMRAMHGECVAIMCQTAVRADLAIQTLRERLEPFAHFLTPDLPLWRRKGVLNLGNGGSVHVYCREDKGKTEGLRARVVISDLDDAIDITTIPKGCPFDTRMFQ